MPQLLCLLALLAYINLMYHAKQRCCHLLLPAQQPAAQALALLFSLSLQSATCSLLALKVEVKVK